MKKLIIDTNIVLLYLMVRDVKSHFLNQLLKLAKDKKITIYYSKATWEELKEVISRDKIKNRLGKSIAKLIADYKFIGTLVDPVNVKTTICRDPKDNKFLELAKEASANYLITGDEDLLTLKEFEQTKILTPSKFIEELKLEL